MCACVCNSFRKKKISNKSKCQKYCGNHSGTLSIKTHFALQIRFVFIFAVCDPQIMLFFADLFVMTLDGKVEIKTLFFKFNNLKALFPLTCTVY